MLNIAHACVTETVNGPGRRFTIWLQGCPRRCAGCFNPGLQSDEPRTLVQPWDLARQLRESGPLAGVTLSGGEPFHQAAEVARFLDRARARSAEDAEGSVIVFTGHVLEELEAGPPSWRDLLARVDLLIDGAYREDRRTESLPLRGSANQRLIARSPRGGRLLARVERDPAAEVQVHISAAGEILVSGFPSAKLLHRLREG